MIKSIQLKSKYIKLLKKIVKNRHFHNEIDRMPNCEYIFVDNYEYNSVYSLPVYNKKGILGYMMSLDRYSFKQLVRTLKLSRIKHKNVLLCGRNEHKELLEGVLYWK